MDQDTQYISEEILSRLGIKFRPGKLSQMVSCPDHPDRHPSCSVDLEKGIYHCFSCGGSGTLKNLYYQTFHRSILKDLGISPVTNPLQKTENEVQADFNKPPVVDLTLKGRSFPLDITEAGKNWIKFRGFTMKDMLAFKARYYQFGICKQLSDPDDKTKWIYVFNRAAFPIFEGNNILSYELRDIMGSTHYEKQLKKKGLSIDDYPYKKVLYPKNSSVNTLYDLNKLKTNDTLYLTEGLMDLIALRTNKVFANSTCLFGAAFKERQVFLLSKFQKIVFIVNNDLPGYVSCKKLMERLPNLSFLCPPKEDGKINDVNDILQKKSNNYRSIQDLLDKGWLKMERSRIGDIVSKIRGASK